jgi:nucleotide-binding universal stress UspA family protein
MQNLVPQTDRPFVVVVGLNIHHTDSSAYALDKTARIAMRIPASEMHLLYVLEPMTSVEDTNEAVGCLQRYVAEKATELGGLAQQSVGIHVRRGEPGHEIGQFANDVSADLVVVGTRRRPHLRQLFVGSTAEHVMANASCPVFVAGPRPAPKPSHAIVIDPPCADCVQMRETTRGQTWWCTRHAQNHHLHAHHGYSYQSTLPFESHDSAVSLTGI